MKKAFLGSIFIYSLVCSAAFAKPMPEPTKEQAFKSSFIAIAEYRGYKKDRKIDYSSGPIAEYKITRLVKGANLPEVLDVRYDFTDHSECVPEKRWRFKEDLMPPKGSKWILFLNKDKRTKYWTTYRGSFGRWEASFENIQELESGIKK